MLKLLDINKFKQILSDINIILRVLDQLCFINCLFVT